MLPRIVEWWDTTRRRESESVFHPDIQMPLNTPWWRCQPISHCNLGKHAKCSHHTSSCVLYYTASGGTPPPSVCALCVQRSKKRVEAILLSVIVMWWCVAHVGAGKNRDRGQWKWRWQNERDGGHDGMVFLRCTQRTYLRCWPCTQPHTHTHTHSLAWQ